LPGPRPARTRLACAVAAAAVLLGACGSTAPLAPKRDHSNLISIFEDEGLLHSDPALALRTFRDLGVDRVRVFLAWNAFAPSPDASSRPAFRAGDPAAYPAASWTLLDQVVRDAAVTGIGLDFTVGGPAPAWAIGPGAPPGSPYDGGWRPSAADFGEFLHALGARYDGRYIPPGASRPLPRVDFWSIWNEPNYGHYLSPQAVGRSQIEEAPRLYRALVGAAWNALLATGHGPPHDTILIGETAPRGLVGPGLPGDFSGMVPLRFIRALYCVDAEFRPLRGSAARLRGCPSSASGSASFAKRNPALFEASGFADHPYPDALAPNIPTPMEPDYADMAVIGHLARTLDRVTGAYGRRVQIPIYSTEFGYRTDPPTSLGIPLSKAALYLNQAEYISWRDPRIRSYDQYLLTDPPPTARSDFDTGIEFFTGRPKPDVYDAYRLPLFLPQTSGRRGQRLEVWGCVRPAPELERRTGRRQRVTIQYEPKGSGRFQRVKQIQITDPHGYFDVLVRFPGSGTVRLQWNGPGGTVISRTQAVTLR
jgi:hypothetical protein